MHSLSLLVWTHVWDIKWTSINPTSKDGPSHLCDNFDGEIKGNLHCTTSVMLTSVLMVKIKLSHMCSELVILCMRLMSCFKIDFTFLAGEWMLQWLHCLAVWPPMVHFWYIHCHLFLWSKKGENNNKNKHRGQRNYGSQQWLVFLARQEIFLLVMNRGRFVSKVSNCEWLGVK